MGWWRMKGLKVGKRLSSATFIDSESKLRGILNIRNITNKGRNRPLSSCFCLLSLDDTGIKKTPDALPDLSDTQVLSILNGLKKP
jgi:hypothetical protein